MEDIYKMKLHETIKIKGGNFSGHYVKRVPGGWIYWFFHPETVSCVFVPFNNEFMKVE